MYRKRPVFIRRATALRRESKWCKYKETKPKKGTLIKDEARWIPVWKEDSTWPDGKEESTEKSSASTGRKTDELTMLPIKKGQLSF